MDNVLGILGLAMRARALAVGTSSVLESVRGGKARLVLIASDASANTQKQLTDKASFRHVPVQMLPYDMLELGHALGKDHTVAVAILQDGFVISYTKACTAK